MRIMIVVPGMPLDLNQIKGGAVAAVSNLLRGFSTLDVQVRVVSFNNEIDEKIIQKPYPNVEIDYKPEGHLPFHSMNYLFHGPKILRKQIRDFNPDIIHFEAGNTFNFARIGVRTKAKFALTIHGMVLQEAKRKKKIRDKMAWYFNAIVQKKTFPKNVIHLSQFSLKLFGDKIQNNVIIPNAIVPGFFNIPMKHGTENKLLYMGVIDNNKNLMYLLQQLRILAEQHIYYSLDVLGDALTDDFRKMIYDYVEENGLKEQVRFRGWVPQTTVMKFIEEADILVVSSKHESLPMVIAESMAAGKVVVASAVGGIPEMINDTVDGYLFKLSGTNELSVILAGLYNNTETIARISANAKQTAIGKYQCENVAKKTIAFYKTCA